LFEQVILSQLLFNEEYGRKTIPFLKEEYFHAPADKLAFVLIDRYVKKYNSFPTKEALLIDLSNEEVNETLFKTTQQAIGSTKREENTDLAWLLDQTEKFCQDKAIYNGIMSSIKILDDKTGKLAKGSIPQILTDALSVSFDTNIGHDFLEDWQARFDFYHNVEKKIPFDLDYFNKITAGGVSRKTLNIILAGTGVGKTRFMCHCAAANLNAGYNVLYITMEMAEERIAERIDANLLDIPISDLALIPKDTYEAKISRLRNKTNGKLIVKEYPSASAGAANFRFLLNELKLKKKFVPDIIYIDYLNICLSSRMKMGGSINSYTYVKAIAEELRGLATEWNVPIVSATQTNREGFVSSDLGLENTSESFGLPATADFMFALISNEELESLNQMMVKQLKNRYADPAVFRKFVIGIDSPKMRFYDCEQTAQEDIDDGPVMEKANFGIADRERNKPKFDRSKLDLFT